MSKKVLIIGGEFYGYTKSVERVFRKLGYETDLVEYRKNYSNTLIKRIRIKFEPIFGINYYKNMVRNKTNQLILKKYSEFKPEVVMVIKGDMLTRNTLMKMRDSKIILWIFDSIFEEREVYKNLDLYNYRFMFEKTDVARLKKQDIESWFLPLAVDESVYFPTNVPKKDIDLLFIGAFYPKRVSILEYLIKNFSKMNIQIYNRYTGFFAIKRSIKYFFKKYRKYFMNKFVTPKEANKLYSRTKIAINIHHEQSKYGCNARFFEILGAETFQLVDNNKFIVEVFSDKVKTYENYEDLKNKIKKYIDNEDLRAAIAEKGYQEVIKNHTFTQRIKYILSKLGD